MSGACERHSPNALSLLRDCDTVGYTLWVIFSRIVTVCHAGIIIMPRGCAVRAVFCGTGWLALIQHARIPILDRHFLLVLLIEFMYLFLLFLLIDSFVYLWFYFRSVWIYCIFAFYSHVFTYLFIYSSIIQGRKKRIGKKCLKGRERWERWRLVRVCCERDWFVVRDAAEHHTREDWEKTGELMTMTSTGGGAGVDGRTQGGGEGRGQEEYPMAATI